MSITSLFFTGKYKLEELASIFKISLTEMKQIQKDITVLIEDVTLEYEPYLEKLREIDAFYIIH